MNARAELDEWIKHEDVLEIYKEHIENGPLGFMDLSAILYLMIKLEGKKYNKEIKHVVIDEAQDYSYIQFKIIRELTRCKSYTIVGDCNQRLINTGEECAMMNLESIFGEDTYEVENFSLSKSYRSTQEIMEYANKFLDKDTIVPLVRHGEKVMEEIVSFENDEFSDTVISLIEDFEEDKLENIAVIFNGKDMLNKYAPIIKERISIQNLDNENIMYKGGKVLLPAYLAKGLEFDGVIVVEDKEVDPLVKYIMSTRALHRLAIVKSDRK